MKIAVVNGPNLNLLGVREPEVYGRRPFDEYFETLSRQYAAEGVELTYFQSNHEGALIDELQRIGFDYDGIVLNAGAYTHTSVALADCIKAIATPVIEVHISNVHSREEFRHHSMISGVCRGVIAGFGLLSYKLAVDAFVAPGAE